VHKPVVVEGVQKGCHVQGVVRRCSDPMCGAVQIQDGAEQVNLVETVRALRARRIRPPPPPPPPPPPAHTPRGMPHGGGRSVDWELPTCWHTGCATEIH
jgi:hypothetical protein